MDVVENALRYNITYAHYFTQRSSLNAGASAYMRMMDNNYQQPAIAGGAPAEAWSFIGKSTLVEPGLFAEYTYQIEDKFSLVVGLRGDYSMIEGDYCKTCNGRNNFSSR